MDVVSDTQTTCNMPHDIFISSRIDNNSRGVCISLLCVDYGLDLVIISLSPLISVLKVFSANSTSSVVTSLSLIKLVQITALMDA